MAQLGAKRKSHGNHESMRVDRKRTLVHSNSVRSDIKLTTEYVSPSATDATTALPSPSTTMSAAPSSDALCTPKGIYACDPPPILPISSRQSRMSFLSRSSSNNAGHDLKKRESNSSAPGHHTGYKRSSTGTDSNGVPRKPLQQALQDLSVKQGSFQRSQSLKQPEVAKRSSSATSSDNCTNRRISKGVSELSEAESTKPIENEFESGLKNKNGLQRSRTAESSRPPRGRSIRISNDDTRATMSMSSDSESMSIGYFTSFEMQLTPSPAP